MLSPSRSNLSWRTGTDAIVSSALSAFWYLTLLLAADIRDVWLILEGQRSGFLIPLHADGLKGNYLGREAIAMAVERPESDGRDVVASLAPWATLNLTLVVSLYRLAVVCAFVSIPFFQTISHRAFADEQEDAVIIPISRVWGFGIPGTCGYMVDEIAAAIPIWDDWDDEPARNFVVAGTGLDALVEAHSVIVKKQSPATTFPEGTELTLIFPPRAYYWPLHLESVERHGRGITVRYQFSPGKDLKHNPSTHRWKQFALVPLGQLPVGTYQVTYEQVPLEAKYTALGFENPSVDQQHLVGKPFAFQIVQNGVDRPHDELLSQSAKERVPTDRIWAYEMPSTRNVYELVSLETRTDADGNTIYLNRNFRGQGSLAEEILHHIRTYRTDLTATGPMDLGPGFVVVGEGIDALRAVHEVMVKGQAPPTSLPSNVALSAVFYACGTSDNMELESIRRRGKTFEVTYAFRSVFDANMAPQSYLALIPLGTLAPATYRLKIVRGRYADRRGEEIASVLDREVCKSFSFEVRDDAPGSSASPGEQQ